MFFSSNLHAASKKELISESNYVLTKSDKINARSGPNTRYKIKCIYIKKHILLKIKNTFENWYEVEDIQGETGWIQKNFLQKEKKVKYATVKDLGSITCYSESHNMERIAFKADYLTSFKVKKCEKDRCLLEKDGVRGWCEKKSLWGLE